MGKYMKKSKIAGDIAVMECTLGVRTRAKTLALQRLQSADPSSSSYLQLRSRRLEKPPPPMPCEYHQSRSVTSESCGQSPSPKTAGYRLRLSSAESVSVGSVSIGLGEKLDFSEAKYETDDLGFEGENNLELETRERSTRESTPCSYIGGSSAIGTPGSTTRRSGSKSASRRLGNDVQRDIPTSQEVEEFFASAERQQQRLFMEKFNFDVVNDLPLHGGRYDWVQVSP